MNYVRVQGPPSVSSKDLMYWVNLAQAKKIGGRPIFCCFCNSDQVIHIGGMKDGYLCFKCHASLVLKDKAA